MPSKSNLALLLVSTIVCLLLGELILRIAAPKNSFNPHKLYCEYDSLLGWRKTPNMEGTHKTQEYEVTEHINSMGIRGPEYTPEKDSGEYRILILGDSYAEGYTVNFVDLFSEVLKDYLNKRCGGYYEVINTGTGGYSTDQEALYFERQGVQFHPDLTILLFCVNDPWYNIQSKYWRGFKPQFVLEGDSLQLTNVPVPLPESRPLFSKIKEWGLENSRLIGGIKNLKDKIKYAQNGQSVPDEWRVFQTGPSAEVTEAWKMTAALLKRLHRRATAAGSGFLVFYIPEKIEVYPDAWEQFIASYSLDEQYFDTEQPRRNLKIICDSLQIRMLDPAPVFIKASKADSTSRFYFEHDWHWNVAGNRLVGKILADSVGCR